MPRAKTIPSTPARQAFESLWAAQGAGPLAYTLADWDPDTAQVCQALLEVLATGAAVMIRPGSGNTALGIAIWEGDTRHPATWFNEAEQLTAWAMGILARAAEIRERGRGANGA